MSNKNRSRTFKKRHFTNIIYNVRDLLCRKFGYKIKPFLFETLLPPNTLMVFTHNNDTYTIFYDYKQFIKTFDDCDCDTQAAYAAAIAAHEMRHYYQHRQMIAKTPKETPDTVAVWRENELNPKDLELGCSLSEFCLQPLELDATLFEYVFAAQIFDLLLLQIIKDEEHFNAMERLYIEYYDETDTDLFNDEVREIIKNKK